MPAQFSGLKACLALVMVVGGITAVAAPAEAASATVSLSRSSAIARENVTVTVKAGQRLKRPVRLEYKNGKVWKQWRKGTTNTAGVKKFTVSTARASIVVRARFPKAKVKGTTRAARTSRTKTLRTVRQTVVLEITKSASGRTASAVTTTTPARKGRKVSLQRRDAAGTWRTIVSGRGTDARGKSSFADVASDLDDVKGAYRVQAWSYAGAPSVTSPTASVVWPQTSLTLSRSSSIFRERVDATLDAGHHAMRPYILEYLSGSTWTATDREGTTGADGTAATTIIAWQPSTIVRARFPRATIDGAARPERVTGSVTLTQVEQSVDLEVAMDGSERTVSAKASVGPVREGRAVTLEGREAGGTWSTVAAGAADAEGDVSFADFATEPQSDGREYRALAGEWRGASEVASSVSAVDWTVSIQAADPQVGVDGADTVLTATTTGPVSSVRFYIDGQEVARDTKAPWEATWAPVRGRHDVTAQAISPLGTALSAVTEFDQPGIGSDASTGLPAGFSIDTLQAGFDLPTSFGVADTGRVFVAEKSGRVRTFMRSADGESAESQLVADLSDRVAQEGDQGMTGLVVDPQFGDGSGEHDRVYVSYVTRDAGAQGWSGQQVQVLDLGEWNEGDDPLGYDRDAVILGRTTGAACVSLDGPYPEDCVPLIGNSHTIGDLGFDHEGNLLIGIGDGSMFAAGLDGRSQSLRAQDARILAGKVLRIDPATGRGVPGNPYYGKAPWDASAQADRGTSNASRVIALGLRNPFRLTTRADGLVMIGDVGEAAWEELNVLPHDHDVTAPANFGWPCYEGSARTNVPVSATQPDVASNPWDQCKLLWADSTARIVDPVHTYAHNGGASLTGGVFYTGDVYPAEYRGNYFFGDYAQDFVRTARVDDQGAVSDVETFAPASVAGGPVKFVQGPDDRIWYASIYDGSLRVIDYAPPSAVATCPVGTFARTYHDLTDSSLRNDPADYEDGWSWVRFVDATLPVAAVGPRECVDAVEMAETTERPHGYLPSDRYGVRWQGRVRLEGGTYQFAATGKDWVRLWVDGEPLGEWFGYNIGCGVWCIGAEVGADRPLKLAPGVHTIRVELVHDAGAASAGLSWEKTSELPKISVTGPANGHEVPATEVGGERQGTVPFEVSVSAANGAPDLRKVVVNADLLHVTGSDQHAHPWRNETFTLSGDATRSATLSGAFELGDGHARGSSVFRIRARVEDASGASRLSAPVYVCLEGNAVGICSTS